MYGRPERVLREKKRSKDRTARRRITSGIPLDPWRRGDFVDDVERLRRWQLVLPHRPYLVRIAVRRGLAWHDAEDCAQEAMVRAVGFATLDETRVLEFLATTTMRLVV